jgi:hypothetical protein
MLTKPKAGNPQKQTFAGHIGDQANDRWLVSREAPRRYPLYLGFEPELRYVNSAQKPSVELGLVD